MLNFDPAFFAFNMIQTKDYFIALGRWGSVLIETIPLIGLYLHCSLPVFLKLFSLSQIIDYILIFGVLFYGLKNNKASLVLMLALVLTFRLTFYYTTAELYPGMALSVLLLGLLESIESVHRNWQKHSLALMACLLVYILSYFHQLTVFTTLFVVLWIMLSNKNTFRSPHLNIILIFILVWTFVRVKILTHTQYENDKIPDVKSMVALGFHFFQLASTKACWAFIKDHLWGALFVFLFNLYVFIRTRDWLRMVLLGIAYPAGFFYIVMMAYSHGDSSLMLQDYIGLMGMFLAVPFIYNAEKIISRKFLMLIYSIILFQNVFAIYGAHDFLTKRLDYMGRLIENTKAFQEKKYLVSSTAVPYDYISTPWAFPFETLMYSSLENKKNSNTFFFTPQMSKYDSLIKVPNIFLGPPWAVTWFWSNSLDSNYFKLPNGPYRKITNVEQDGHNNLASLLTPANLHVISCDKEVKDLEDPALIVNLKIDNASGIEIPTMSANEQVPFAYLTYTLKDSKGNISTKANEVKTNMEMDLGKLNQQGLTVLTPTKMGIYSLRPELHFTAFPAVIIEGNPIQLSVGITTKALRH